MRTLKFRGKRLDNQEWEQGNYVAYKEDDGESMHCIVSRERNQIGASLDFVPVAPETVGQSTGLLDKNGKEIYEGDVICESVDGITTDWMVRYDTSLAEYRVENIGDECDDIQLNDVWLDKSEIIGNIHDNPELLKTE